MKKFLSIFIILAVLISLFACSSKTTYTKEFTYIPSYSGMQLSSYTPATKKTPLATARYTIKNSAYTVIYINYENILKKDGWTITNGQKYFAISAKKDNHLVNILIQPSGKNVILVVISK